MAALHAHATRQPPARQAALIDGSAALRDYLGIGDGAGTARIPDSEAAAALALVAAHSSNETHVRRALDRLDDTLAAGPHAANAHQQRLESVLATLLPALHQLTTEAVRRQAVNLIAQRLFPQLQADGQARLRARIRAAMAQRSTGGALAQQLATMLPAARPDRRGRAGFEAALRPHAFASRAAGAPLPSAAYGPFNAVQAACTSYARQAAERLVDSSGRLARGQIAGMLKDLDGDTDVLAEHKAQLRNTFGALRYDRVLGATIDSICEHAAPSGAAADAVRASLNLPPGQALTKVEARKAVVMALLGYLRQGTVGSCYATAPAICLLESSPEAVAKDLKELLETNRLTFSRGNVEQEVPLNQHVQELHGQAMVRVKPDGTTLLPHAATNENGQPDVAWQDSYKLHEIAGMRAALTSLGIPEDQRPDAVCAALQRMSSHGIDPEQGVSFQQLIHVISSAGLAPSVEPLQRAFLEAHYRVAVDGDGHALHALPGVQAALAAMGVPPGQQYGFVASQLQAGLADDSGQVDLRPFIRALAHAVSGAYTADVAALASGDIDSLVKTRPDGMALDGSGLHEMALLRDALDSLGIPEAHRQAAIMEALQRVYRSGLDPVKDGVSCRQLIEQLVQANPAWMERLAIGAFTARHNAVKINAEGVLDDGTRLQDLPGIRTALGLLGIAEAEWQDAIRGALERLAENNVRLDQDIPLARVVTQLAADPHDLAEVRKRRKNALRAFNGTQDVSLLKTWEFTLAGASQLYFRHLSRPSQWSVAQLGHGIFHGDVGEHENSMEQRAPGLYSLQDQSQLFVDDLQLEPEFEDIDVGEVRDRVFSEITSTMRQRFTYDMDMNLQGDASTDGVSTHGGFVLYEKTPADDPARWKRIDNAPAFMDAMERLVQDAVDATRLDLEDADDAHDAEIDALERIADFLQATMGGTSGREEFIKHAVLLMNLDDKAADFSMDKIDSYKLTPWKKTDGSYSDPILAHYGSSMLRHSPPQPVTDAVTSMVNSFCAGLARMAPMLHNKAAQAPDGFKIPVSLPGHVFTLMPLEMQELWSSDPATRMPAAQWIDAHVRAPAAAWRDAPRTSAELAAVLQAAGTALGAGEQDMREIEEALAGQAPPTTLGAVHAALGAYCQTRDNGDALLARAEHALMTRHPVPAKIIGDTNWMSAEGRPVHIGILHNPFRDKLDAQRMHADGSDRAPLVAAWTDPATFVHTFPVMYTPLAKSRGGDGAGSSGQKRKMEQR